jgi:hypothetical protein
MAIEFDCPQCGRRLRVAEEARGKKAKCPRCAAVMTAPSSDEDRTGASRVAQAVAPLPVATAARTRHGDEADGYSVHETGPTCPGCHKVLARGAVLCVDCGIDLRTGRRLKTVRDAGRAYERRWDSGAPLVVRLVLFLVLEFLCFLVGALTRDLILAVLIVFTATVFLALLLGTFITLRLKRTGNGKVLLTRVIHLFFIPAIRTEFNLQRYDALQVADSGAGFGPVGWIILIGTTLLLLPFGVVPGLLWWYWALTRQNFRLDLNSDRRDNPVKVYWTHSDSTLRDIADTLQEAAGLRVERR